MENGSWRIEFRRHCNQVFSLETLRNLFPVAKWLPKYRVNYLQGDIIAGLTVGLTVIPQGLALAHVARLPPQYGLYSSFLGCFVYVFLGTSKDITLGPTAIMSLLISQFGQSPVPGDATYAIILSLIGGIVQMVMGILQIGFVINYISHPVINSFTTAAAITIAEGQFKNLLGLHNIPRDFLSELYWTLRKIPETNLWDLMIGLACLFLLICLKLARNLSFGDGGHETSFGRLKRIIGYAVWLVITGRNALVVLIAAVTVGICQSKGFQPFTTAGDITPGLPPFHAPAFELTYNNHTYTAKEISSQIGAGFAVIPILGLVETMAIGKVFAKRNGYTIDPNQEFIAVGVSNVLGSFFSAYPVTGSFSRTAVNSASGVRTPAGGICIGLLVILSLLFLTPYFTLIPNAALAAVIIMAVSDMVDFSLLKKLWQVKRIDLIPWILTFVFSFVLGVEWGILIGIGVSLLMILYPWGRPVITDITDAYLQLGELQPFQDIIVISLNQGLVFPGVEIVKESVASKALACDSPKSVIFDCSHIANIDYTSVEGIGHLLDDFKKMNVVIVFCCLQPHVFEVLEKADIVNFIHAFSVRDGIRLVSSGILSSLSSADLTHHLLDDVQLLED